MSLQSGLAPFISEKTEKLILGSAPSIQSLKQQHYYGNKGNQFWKIVFTCLGENDPIDYSKRLALLEKHRIGLWDVYGQFQRQGSMDHQFETTKLNDFSFLNTHPSITTIIANGHTAYQAALTIPEIESFPLIKCGSTSGANNGQHKKRLAEWQQALTMSI